jgi:tetratricopeptide (TPR) repeat protein
MQWSYELLSASEQHLFRQLAVVSGGCTLAAAACIGNTSDEYEALEQLTRLHDKSLLQVDRLGKAEPRYRMLETVRQYALERLNDAGEAEAARDRHLAHFAALADAADNGLVGPDLGKFLTGLKADNENLLAALAWAEQASDGGEKSLRLVASLGRYWVLSDQLECGLRVTSSAVHKANSSIAAQSLARSLFELSRLSYLAGQYDQAAKAAEESLQLARNVDDKKTVLWAMTWLANARSEMGKLDEARMMLEQCCGLATSSNDDCALGSALVALGELNRATGNLSQAAASYDEATRIFRNLRSPLGLCTGLGNLARTHIFLGQYECARTELLEVIQTAMGAGLRSTCACALDPTAALAHVFGDSERGVRYFGAAEVARELAFHARESLDEDFIKPIMADAREALGTARYNVVERAGRDAGYDETLADALRWLQHAAN